MYSAFSRREAAVTLLEVRAGSPPSVTADDRPLQSHPRPGRAARLVVIWESWFVDVEETHTSLSALSFFRSPQPERSWITAAGAVLDAAAFAAAALDLPRDPQRDLTLRAGYLALRHIADFFAIPYNQHPAAGDPISVTRQEFDAACDDLAQQGVPLKLDRDQAWRDFCGWRVNYDTVLLALCSLIISALRALVLGSGLRVRVSPLGSPGPLSRTGCARGQKVSLWTVERRFSRSNGLGRMAAAAQDALAARARASPNADMRMMGMWRVSASACKA